MFSEEMISILKGVFTSWQVIAVTIAVVLYLFLITYVANLSRRRSFSMRPAKVKKKKAAPAAESTPESSEASDNEELGLEEE
jgi:hypothetical protein